MSAALPYFFGLAAFATLAVLVIGIVSFAVHGRFYHHRLFRRTRAVLSPPRQQPDAGARGFPRRCARCSRHHLVFGDALTT